MDRHGDNGTISTQVRLLCRVRLFLVFTRRVIVKCVARHSLCVVFIVLVVLSFHMCHACVCLSFSTPRGESCAPVLRQRVSVDASR